MRKIKIISLCVSAVTLGVYLTPVQAQEEPAKDKKTFASSALEEVVVTARKKEEDLQIIPLAIKAVSSEALEQRGISNLEDVANTTPGLTYAGGATSGYQSSATIRGLSQGFLQDRTQNVAIFLDGIYLQRQSMANVGMIDMQRIEVVKGPQSALYGRNAFSGAINYVTKKPTEEFEGYVSTTQGSHGREDYQIRVSGPVIEDKLFASWTYAETLYDGHTENRHPYAKANPPGFTNGGSDGRLGGWDDDGYNAQFVFKATDDLTFNGGFFRNDMKKEGQPGYLIAGLLEPANFLGQPFSDMNYNRQTVASLPRNATKGLGGESQVINRWAQGNTMWAGRLPTRDPKGTYVGTGSFSGSNGTGGDGGVSGEYIPGNNSFGFSTPPTTDPRRSGILSDPRDVGAIASTDLITLGVSWTINDSWSAKYLYGNVDHEGYTGGAADRDPLYGSVYSDTASIGVPSTAYPCTGGDCASTVDKYVQINAFSGRPIIDTQAESHELRFDWAGNDKVSGSFGFYFSKTEDNQYDLTTYAPICTTPDQLLDQDQDPSAACYEALNPDYSPLFDLNANTSLQFFGEYWNGKKGNNTDYEDRVRSAFFTLDFKLREDLKLRLEGRYSEEKRRINRLTDQFGLGPGQGDAAEFEDDLRNGTLTFANGNLPPELLYIVPRQAAASGDMADAPLGGVPTTWISGICAPGKTTAVWAQDLSDGSNGGGNGTGSPNGRFDDVDTNPNDNIYNGDVIETIDCITAKDSVTEHYFAPRIGLDWQITDDNMAYTYLAKGVKAGGFNNTSSPAQQTYDQESNWTFEIGSKNTFLDGALTLNGAIYYVDWADVQGGEAPQDSGGNGGPNANVVTGNISGVTNLGFEIDGIWNVTDIFYIDFGWSHTDPEYDDDARYDAAQRYYYYKCDPTKIGQYEGERGNQNNVIEKIDLNGDGRPETAELCGDANVGGNQLARVSKDQYTWGFNVVTDVADGWTMTARLDGNYQSKQYIDPLNIGYIPSRTLWNASVKLAAPNNWEFIAWGKNITDKEYITGAFVMSLFNKYIVSYGAGESYGITAKYNF
jgi:outer membrane receptor protein involved in Fe transport